MRGIEPVRKPYKGWSARRMRLAAPGGQVQAEVDRNAGTSARVPSGASAKRVSGDRAKSRPRLRPVHPRRAKPKGAASSRRANPTPAARDSGKGRSPGTAACRAGPLLRQRYQRQEKRYVGPSGRKRTGYLAGGGSSEGWIPRAPPVWNKTGKGAEGVNRQEGTQTLQADRGASGKAAARGLPLPWALKGPKSPWEVSSGPGRSTRVRWAMLWRRAKLEERRVGRLTVASRFAGERPHSRGNGQRHSGIA